MARLLAAVGALAMVLVLGAGTAHAHAILESSSPAANSVLETGPSDIVLDFDEPVDASVSSIRLFDQQRDEIELDDLQSSGGGSVLSAGVPPLDDGLYVVLWRVASSDGHVVDGAYSFQVGTAASGLDPDDLIGQITSGSGASTAVSWALGVSRFVAYLGIVGMFGVALLGLGTPAVRRARRLGTTAWALALVGAVATYGAYAASVAGGGLADAFSPSAWSDIVDTRTGTALLARIALLGVIAALFARRSRWAAPEARVAGFVLLTAVAVTHAVAGHASGATPSWLYVGNDALHLAAVGVWVGGLVALACGGRTTFDDPESVPLVHRFSAAALVAVPVIVVSGVVQTLELAGGLGDLTATAWGRTLLVKVVLVLVLVVLGGIGRWLLRNDGPSGLRRGVLVEAAVGIVVLAVAATLVGQPPRESAAGQVVSTTVTAGGVIADITVTPGRVGGNEIHMVLTPPGGNLEPVVDLTARMSNEAAGIPTTPVTVTQLGTNHYVGSVTLPVGGAWTLELVVTAAPATTVLLSTPIDVPG